MSDSEAAPDFFQALAERHRAQLTRQEFTRAVRALSARYVERRGQLPDRSPLDSAGKRAAFGLYYAAVHFVTVEAVLSETARPRRPLSHLIDLGCGTGVCSAAWARALPAPPPTLDGIDLNGWAVDEARWNWRMLGLRGRATRADAVDWLERQRSRITPRTTGLILGWTVNELPAPARTRLLTLLLRLVEDGAALLVIEPLARGVSPWWEEWVDAFAPLGAAAGDCKMAPTLPSSIAELGSSAGLSPPSGARVLQV